MQQKTWCGVLQYGVAKFCEVDREQEGKLADELRNEVKELFQARCYNLEI